MRGIVAHSRRLYAADEAGNAVKIFEIKSGRLVAHSGLRSYRSQAAHDYPQAESFQVTPLSTIAAAPAPGSSAVGTSGQIQPQT